MKIVRTLGLAVLVGGLLTAPAFARCYDWTVTGASHIAYSGNNAGSKSVFYGDVGAAPAGGPAMPSLSDLGSASAYTYKDPDQDFHKHSKWGEVYEGSCHW